jgi:hypothetical protein
MNIDVFSASELPMVLRVLRTALATDGALAPNERLFLETYATIAGAAPPSSDPAPIDVAQVAVATPHRKKRLVQLSALAVLLGRPVRPASVAFLKALARQLATHDPVIDVIDALLHGRNLQVRLMAMRRGLRVLLKEAWRTEGALGVLRFVGALCLKTADNTPRPWHNKRLGLLPDGTLGREYWKHMTAVGFGFPGEPAGIPDAVAYHDIAHVLAEHETTPLGEIQQGSFQAGNRREDGFFFVQFVVLHFHQGVQITPGAPPATGHFEPDKALWALQRGARCNVDMTHRWDFWPLMALPIEEARRHCGLMPRPASLTGQLDGRLGTASS